MGRVVTSSGSANAVGRSRIESASALRCETRKCILIVCVERKENVCDGSSIKSHLKAHLLQYILLSYFSYVNISHSQCTLHLVLSRNHVGKQKLGIGRKE